MPFRQIVVVVAVFAAIVLAAVFILSWDGANESDTADGGDPDGGEADLGADGADTTTTVPTPTAAPVTTSIPFACGADPATTSVDTAPTTTTTFTTTSTAAPGVDPTDTTDSEAPLVPTLGPNSSLSTVGLDRVTFGLTVSQARAAAGTEMTPCEPAGDCHRVTPAVAPNGISFLVHEGTIERVDIAAGSPITTVSGAGIGTTVAELAELFGDQLEEVDLGGGTVDLIFVPSAENDAEFRVAFTTVGGAVETMRAGRLPMVLEDDPCA